MTTAQLDGDFPVTRCAACGREVLCYFELDDRGNARTRCVECETPADPEAMRWVDLRGLEALGYGAVSPDAGCGRSGCGTGGCGAGRPE